MPRRSCWEHVCRSPGAHPNDGVDLDPNPGGRAEEERFHVLHAPLLVGNLEGRSDVNPVALSTQAGSEARSRSGSGFGGTRHQVGTLAFVQGANEFRKFETVHAILFIARTLSAGPNNSTGAPGAIPAAASRIMPR